MHKNYLALVLLLLSVQSAFSTRTDSNRTKSPEVKRFMDIHHIDVGEPSGKSPENQVEKLSNSGDIAQLQVKALRKKYQDAQQELKEMEIFKQQRQRVEEASLLVEQLASLANGSGESSPPSSPKLLALIMKLKQTLSGTSYSDEEMEEEQCLQQEVQALSIGGASSSHSGNSFSWCGTPSDKRSEAQQGFSPVSTDLYSRSGLTYCDCP